MTYNEELFMNLNIEPIIVLSPLSDDEINLDVDLYNLYVEKFRGTMFQFIPILPKKPAAKKRVRKPNAKKAYPARKRAIMNMLKINKKEWHGMRSDVIVSYMTLFCDETM